MPAPVPGAWTIAAAWGVLSGILMHVALAAAPEAMVLAPLPLFAAGLWLGASPGLMAIAAAAATTAVLVAPMATVVFAVAVGAPAGLIVLAAVGPRRVPGGWAWPPPGRPLLWLTGYALVLVALRGIEAGGDAGTVELAGQLADQMAAMLGAPLPPAAAAMVGVATVLAPALTAMAWLGVLWLGAAAVQAVLVRWGLALRPTPAFAAIELPRAVGVAMLGAAAVALVADGDIRFAAVSALPVLGLAYLVVGLAVLHGRARLLKRRRLALVGLYGLLAFGGIVAMLPIAAVGLIDQWIPLRRRDGGLGRGM